MTLSKRVHYSAEVFEPLYIINVSEYTTIEETDDQGVTTILTVLEEEYSFSPADDLTTAPALVQTLGGVLYTQEVIDAYNAV